MEYKYLPTVEYGYGSVDFIDTDEGLFAHDEAEIYAAKQRVGDSPVTPSVRAMKVEEFLKSPNSKKPVVL